MVDDMGRANPSPEQHDSGSVPDAPNTIVKTIPLHKANRTKVEQQENCHHEQQQQQQQQSFAEATMQTTGESIDAVVQRLVDQGVFCAVPLTLDRKPQACIPAKQLDYVMTWACYEARVPYGPQQQQRVIHALATKLSPNIKIASKFRDPASRIEVKNSIVNVKICSEMMAPQQQQHPQQQKHPQPPPRAVPPQQQPPPRWTTSTSLQAALAATGRLSPSATRPSSFSSSAGSLNRMPPHVGWDQRAAAAAQHARTSSIYGSSSLGSLVGQERPASCRTAAGPAVPTAVGSGERICYARTQMETDNVHGGRTDPYSLVQLSLQSGFPMVPLVDEAGKGLLATVRVSFLPVQGHEKAPMVTVRGTDDPAFTAAAAVGVAMAKELVPRVQAALGLAPVPRAMLAAPVVVEVGYPGASYKGGSVGLAATLAYFKAVFQEELNLGGVVATGILDFDGDIKPVEGFLAKAGAAEDVFKKMGSEAIRAFIYSGAQEERPLLNRWAMRYQCGTIDDVDDLMQSMIAAGRNEEDLQAYLDARVDVSVLHGQVLTLRGRTQDRLLSVTAWCGPGTGALQITSVPPAKQPDLCTALRQRLRELGQVQPVPHNLQARIGPAGQLSIRDAAGREQPLDVLVAVGDGTVEVDAHETELLAWGALLKRVLAPVGTGAPRHHVILADVFGSVIHPVSLECPERHTPNNVRTVKRMLPGLDEIGTGQVDIICGPDTSTLLGRGTTRYHIKAITWVEQLPIALGVRAGEIVPPAESPVRWNGAMTLQEHNGDVHHGRSFSAGTVITQVQQDALLAIFQQMHGNNHAATVADVAAADLLVDQAGSALPAEQLLLAVPQAYQQQDFAEMNFPVFQVPMRGPSISQAFLRAARRICYESMGFNTHTCPSAAPPAPAEVLEVFEQLRRLSGSLLDGLELVTIICNKQDDDPKAKGKAHKDPADYGGIVGINLGPGTATMDLLEPRVGKHEVAYTQVLALGTAYILVGDSVKYYNHIISAPTGGERYVIIGRYISAEVAEKVRAAM